MYDNDNRMKWHRPWSPNNLHICMAAIKVGLHFNCKMKIEARRKLIGTTPELRFNINANCCTGQIGVKYT